MVNHIIFQGRLTRDLEVKETNSGIKHAAFTLAWSEKYKETETKCFMRCKAWRSTAEFMQKYLNAKGTEMLVEGRLVTNEWTDNEGQQRSVVELDVSRVHFCGKKSESAAPETPTLAEVPDDGGELPF